MAHNIYSKTESRDGKPIKKQIIIAEKSTAAETIANNLSDGPVKSETKGPVTVWFIKFLGIDTVVIPLKGHIKDVKYSEEFKQWSEETLEKMIDAKLIYVDDAVDNIEIIEKYAKDADRVIIATDYDTEGESIGFEAIDVVRRVNKDVKIYRSVFSSLTKEELTEAFSNLKEPDKNLADSADARREVDLIIGAVLTRFISLAAHRLGNSFLSIGRVQTPTLTLIADREVERRAFKPKDYWIFTAKLKVRGSEFLASYKEEKIFDEKTVDKLRKLKNIKEARVVSVEKKERSVSPPKPFNTTDFLRSAAAIGFSVPNAMRIA
ncbi:MAG: DNA topoisomerase, partial [Nanoarchaeota archaeon]|nr:DNA topoisomerase [Nanoarchaeota archaeon]